MVPGNNTIPESGRGVLIEPSICLMREPKVVSFVHFGRGRKVTN